MGDSREEPNKRKPDATAAIPAIILPIVSKA
jgi:hypothetical protein